jgi:hypothetical protein
VHHFILSVCKIRSYVVELYQKSTIGASKKWSYIQSSAAMPYSWPVIRIVRSGCTIET